MPTGIFTRTKETREKMREARIGKSSGMLGKKHSEATKKKLSGIVKKQYADGKVSPFTGMNGSGSNHPKWIADRNMLKKGDKRHGSAYVRWQSDVYKRDSFKCRIENGDCCGKIEAHHILSWRDYKELRYEINNGITLCHAHHPRKWEEESKLSPYFKKLILEKNNG